MIRKQAVRESWRFLAPALAAALVVSACERSTAEERPALQSAAIERRDLRVTAEATGQVEPITSVEVKSKAAGEVLRIHVETGDPVPAGALLAEIDPRDVRNAHDQAVADLEVAKARVEIAEANLERSRELFESQVITRQEFEAAKLDQANAQAALVKAKTNLELAQQRLGDVTIRAPTAGTIIQKSVEEGQVITSASSNISGGTTLFIMANLSRMQARTLVDETDMGRIRSGQAANVAVEAYPGRTFVGEVEKIEPQAVVQQNVTMFPVIVRLDNREGLLRPGMNAEVEILIAERPGVLTAPNNAIVYPQDVGPAAMVLGLDPAKLQIDRRLQSGPLAAEGSGVEGLGADGDTGGTAEGARAEASRPDETREAGAGNEVLRAEWAGDSAGVTGRAGAEALADSLRRLVRSGQISQDSARAMARRLRASGAPPRGAGAGPGGRPGSAGGSGPGAGAASARRWSAGRSAADSGVKPAVVFVVDSAGAIEPRPVLIGLNDWDYTEILRGVEQGEKIALIGAAQLQARQQEWVNQIRERRGGMFPGGPGPGPGPGAGPVIRIREQ
ncbi:MAG: efflux RND transporter periplasmic adaptor subunit [Gemmatimonadetes bacterium]|nr:efflux RND transporter periplasmic adaptor subunit [Gemmatimonadota bacterium]